MRSVRKICFLKKNNITTEDIKVNINCQKIKLFTSAWLTPAFCTNLLKVERETIRVNVGNILMMKVFLLPQCAPTNRMIDKTTATH